MKLILVFFILITAYSSCNATAQELFLQANNAYKKGNFSQALDAFNAIDNKGAAVWYNMGNAYYHLNRYVDALIAWKRALKYDGFHLIDAINANSDCAYDKLEIKQSYGYLDWVTKEINRRSLFFWQFIFLCSLYGFLLVLYGVKNKKWLIFICLLVINSTGIGLIVRWQERNCQTGIVISDTFLVAGNDEQFSKIGALKPGQEVIIKEKNQSWCKVAVDNQIGWILNNNVEFI